MLLSNDFELHLIHQAGFMRVSPLQLLRRTAHNFSVLDTSVLCFLFYFNVRLNWAVDSADANLARGRFLGILILFVVSMFVCRGELIQHPRARGIIHRFSLLFSILGLYLIAMREALAALQPILLDLQLAEVDRMLFGGVPSQMLERFNHPMVTEWFAFFYYSYFIIIVLATLPSAFFGRSSLARGLVQGSVMIVCIGHIIYTLVPGRGPYVALQFEHDLSGGLFWHLVNQTVVTQGALLDIFPSLHTALPTFIALYLTLYRRSWPLRIPWLVLWVLLVLFTINIIIATLYLRWHYAIDVIAGVILAFITMWIVRRTNPSDEVRKSRGQHPIFEPCLGGLWPKDRA
jgi:membrane-associated phospholipid phosphatase